MSEGIDDTTPVTAAPADATGEQEVEKVEETPVTETPEQQA